MNAEEVVALGHSWLPMLAFLEPTCDCSTGWWHVGCRCGWYGDDESEERARALFAGHLEDLDGA